MLNIYYLIILIMFILGIVVFISLFKFKAGYGKLSDKKWGKTINNKVGWFIMESPTIIITTTLLIYSKSYTDFTLTFLISLYLIHYFYRVIIFPLKLRSKSNMPILIILMGFIFNSNTALLISYSLFYVIKDFNTILIMIGSVIYTIGFIINKHSDYVIRNLRKDSQDNKHYFPKKGFYKYVTSASYFGEIVQWTGFAIATQSLASYIYLWWTIANLLPRSISINHYYRENFSEEFDEIKPKKLIPFIL